MVDEHDRDVDTAEDVPEVVVQQRQFRIVLLQLLVDGSELLIARLQLLLCSLELFVRRLEFFVARDNLFVRRLQLLIRRLLVLDHRTKVSFRRRQFFAELRSFGARAPPLLAGTVSVLSRGRGCRRGAEDDEEVPVTRRKRDGRNLDIHGHGTTVGVEPNVGPRHGCIAAACIANQVGQDDRQAGSRHFGDVQARVAWRGRQIRACVPTELHDVHRLIQDDPRRRVLIEQEPVDLSIGVARRDR